MPEKHQPTDMLRLKNNLTAPHTPGDNSAGCDPDFDTVSDDEREIADGLRDLARMEGEGRYV